MGIGFGKGNDEEGINNPKSLTLSPVTGGDIGTQEE